MRSLEIECNNNLFELDIKESQARYVKSGVGGFCRFLTSPDHDANGNKNGSKTGWIIRIETVTKFKF